MKTEKIDQILAKGKEVFYYGKTLERKGRLYQAIKWYYKARETMNEIFTDNSIQIRNLMWHLGVCLCESERSDEALPFLKIYASISKQTVFTKTNID